MYARKLWTSIILWKKEDHLSFFFITKKTIFSNQKIFYCLLLEQGARIGLYFINRPEWIIVDHACSAYSYISVPLYDTLGMFFCYLECLWIIVFSKWQSIPFILSVGPDAVKFVVNHSSIEVIFCVSQTLSIVSSIPSYW